MKTHVVDVVIPVYKTEQYLDECVQSVLEQDYPDIRIILVDDGSPDRCGAMCDGYARRDGRIRVVHQENRGLGNSRNSGMEASDGEYVLFLDSDDKLDGSRAISRLAARAEETGADITVGNFRRFHEGYLSEPNQHHLRGGSYTRTADFRFKGFYRYGHLSYDWGKLYRRSFLEEHGLKCMPYPFTQDKPHNMMCCACEPVYAFVDDSVCQYRVNESSVTFRYKENYMPVWIAIARDFQAFLRDREIGADYGDLIAFHFFFGSIFLAKQELQRKKWGVGAAAKVMEAYGSDPLVRESMEALARGEYMKGIDAPRLMTAIRASARLFTARGYGLYALGIALFTNLKVDKRITRSGFQKKR